MATYSFKDVGAAIEGPGGNYQLGHGAGVAEEGITVERNEDRNTMAIGADGEVMHSLHSGNGGTVRIRLLKTSPTNGQLQMMLNDQSMSGARWGRNTIQVRDFIRGDIITCREVAFAGHTPVTYGKTGNMNEWVFHAGHIDIQLDRGVPPPSV